MRAIPSHGFPAARPQCTGSLSFSVRTASRLAAGVDKWKRKVIASAHKAETKVENLVHISKSVILPAIEEKRWDPEDARRDERSRRDYANAMLDSGLVESRSWGGYCH